MKWKQKFPFFILLSLILLSFITPAFANVTVRQNQIIRTSSNNAKFIPVSDLTFFRTRINSTHASMDQSYSFKHYTEYYIWVWNPSNVQFGINYWFPTKTSSNYTEAKLTLISPLTTNIKFSVYSSNFISVSATGVASQTWTSSNKTLSMVANSNTNTIIIIKAYVTETLYNNAPENVSVVITDMEGCGTWVFAETKYYTFQAVYWDGDGHQDLSLMKIAFTDGVHWINVTYNQNLNAWSLDTGADYVYLKAGTVTFLDAKTLQVTFLIYFKSSILDSYDISIYMYCSDLSGTHDDWTEAQPNYFSIYNLGGKVTLTKSGNAGLLTGGDWINIYANESSWCKVTQDWRKLQGIEMLLALGPLGNDSITETAMPGSSKEQSNELEFHGYWYFGIDYCVGDTWYDGWYVRLELVRNDYTGSLGSPADQITIFNATWFYRGQQIKWNYVGCWYEGWGSESEKNVVRLDINLWFNKMNASTTFGGWVSPMYYAMKGQGTQFAAGPFLPWTGSYAPLLSFDPNNSYLHYLNNQADWNGTVGPSVDSFYFDSLKYPNGTIFSSKQIKMMRLWAKVERDSDVGGWVNKIEYAEKMQYTLTTGDMAGIDTPAYFEPQEPQIQSWGFLSLLNLGPLIKSLSNIFGPALLGFWNAFVGFLDTVFTAFGWSNGFSQLLLWISNLGSFLVNAFTTLIQWLTVLFNILVGSTSYITSVLTGIGIIITNIFSVFSMMSSILSTGFSQFTPLILPVLMLLGIFLPAIELNRMSKYGFGTLFEDLNKVMDVASFVVNGMIQVIQLFIAVVGRLIESIPILE